MGGHGGCHRSRRHRILQPFRARRRRQVAVVHQTRRQGHASTSTTLRRRGSELGTSTAILPHAVPSPSHAHSVLSLLWVLRGGWADTRASILMCNTFHLSLAVCEQSSQRLDVALSSS